MDNQEKKYGYYKGMLSDEGAEIVTTGSEYSLYSTIDSLGYFIWRYNHDLADGRIASSNEINTMLEEAQYAIEFAVLNTRRFGVEIPEPEDEKHVENTDSYKKWYEWWDNYIKNVLSNEEYNLLQEKVKNGEEYYMYRPEGSWKEESLC